jgi:hypothetical protein
VTVHTLFLITNHVTVSQHGAAFVRDVQEIAMAFLALVVGEGGVCLLPLLLVIILLLKEVDENVLGAMKSLSVEELKGILGSWRGLKSSRCCRQTGSHGTKRRIQV